MTWALLIALCFLLSACGGDMEITQGYNKDGVCITEVAKLPDGSVYEHVYDKDGNHVSEKSTLADGSYHEFQYDKNGNVVSELHK